VCSRCAAARAGGCAALSPADRLARWRYLRRWRSDDRRGLNGGRPVRDTRPSSSLRSSRSFAGCEVSDACAWEVVLSADFGRYWVYVVGPLLGAVIAVGFAFVLRGRGGGLAGSAAAQGGLFTTPEHPEQT
jgi:hypothetical protein